jgi:hypothetical protein
MAVNVLIKLPKKAKKEEIGEQNAIPTKIITPLAVLLWKYT